MWAERVEEDLAAKIALGFYAYKSKTAGDISSIQGYPADKASEPDIYVVNFEPMGFVLITADDRSEPILGYSTDSFFPLEGLPDHVDWFLGEYSKSLAEIRQHPEWGKNLSWDRLSSYDFSDYVVTRDVTGLCATRWDQNWPYNALCPTDSSGPGGRVYAGCVATAMAQIMKKWDHPTTGQGSHSYNATGYGTQTANFGDTIYEWQNMPNSIYTQNNSIATLIYHCGVSVNMQYSPNGSGAYSNDARNAMVNYFRFHNSASYVTAASYGPTAWANLLIENLDSSRPILYSGQGIDGGHAFVLDGYQGTSYFHFVWGWGNSYVGYYYLNNLNPGSNNFTGNQAALINLYPINQPANDMAAYSIYGEQELALGEQYTFQIGVRNNGPNPQNNYTVQLYVDDTLVGSQTATTQLLWGQGASFDFNWTPTTLGTHTLYGKVILAGDLNPDNDYTDELVVEVFEEVYTTVQIGASNLYNTYAGVHTPYGSQSRAYRQQYLLTSDELVDAGAGAGSFLSLAFEVRSVNNCPPIPNYKIRLKHTQSSSLTQNFEAGYYQTVCEYDEYLPVAGWNEHEFISPFAWDGVSNLIVDITTDLREPMTTQCSSVYHTYSSFDSSLRFDSNAVNGINGTSGTLGRSRANIRLIYRDAGNEPEIIISPSVIDFGDLSWGETEVVYANLSNIGGGCVELWEGNFAFTGEHAEMFFHGVSAYPVSLESGQSFAFPIFVIADQFGQLSASLVISYGGVDYEVELRCYCNPPAIEQFPFFEGFEEGNVNHSTNIYMWDQMLGAPYPEVYWMANTDTNDLRAPRSGDWNAILTVGGKTTLLRPIMLQNGQGYSLRMWARQDTNAGVKLQAFLCEDKEFAGDLVLIMRPLWVLGGDYQEFYGEFRAPATGTYYLGIKAVVDHPAAKVCLDDITIDLAEITEVYEAPTNLQASVNGTNVLLSWEAPELERDDRDYVFIGYNIFMDDELITFIDDTQTTVFRQHSVPNGEHLYGVSAIYSTGDSEPVTSAVSINIELEDVIFEDGFESYPDFATSFEPWTLIDVDGAQTSGIDIVQFPGSGTPMAFMIFNPQMTDPPLPILAYEGNRVAAAFASIGVLSNDFLITPRLQLGTNSIVKFHACSYIPRNLGPSFRLGISTATDPSLVDEYDYILGEDFLFAPDYWEEFCFDISQYDNQEVFIAIQSSFDHAYAFMVDNYSVHCGPVSTDDETAPALISAIRGNYPNPFNPTTTISYVLGDASQVKIDVYNLKGQLVRHLVDAEIACGEHQVVWDGCDDHNRAVSSGVYLLKMNAGKHSSTKKMLMMK